MTFETATIFIISLILLWIKPGPGQAFIITRALNDGFWAAFYVVLGITTGAVISFLIAALGLEMLTQFFNKIGFIFKLFGAVYFIHVGLKTLKNRNVGHWQGRTDKSKKRRFFENYPAALLLTLGNPFSIFYFLGIMPTLIPLGNLTLNNILIGVAIVTAVGLIVDTLIILLVSQVKDLLSDTKRVHKMNLITGTGFVLIAIFLVYSAFFQSNFSYDLL